MYQRFTKKEAAAKLKNAKERKNHSKNATSTNLIKTNNSIFN